MLTDFVWLHEVNLLLSFLDTKIIFYIVLVFLFPVVVYLVFRNRFLAGKLVLKKYVRMSLLILLATIFILGFVVFKNEKMMQLFQELLSYQRLTMEWILHGWVFRQMRVIDL